MRSKCSELCVHMISFRHRTVLQVDLAMFIDCWRQACALTHVANDPLQTVKILGWEGNSATDLGRFVQMVFLARCECADGVYDSRVMWQLYPSNWKGEGVKVR